MSHEHAHAHAHEHSSSPAAERHCDVAVIGGSAAGLAAALQLGRQRRSVIVVDAGEPRNAPAEHMHSFLGREGQPPSELTRAGRNRGQIQDVLTATLRELVEVTDQLRACGLWPDRQFAGDEKALWDHAVRYVGEVPWQAPPADLPFEVVADDARRVREAWDRFTAFAAGLDAGVFGAIPALDPQFLRPERLAHLVGGRGRKPAPADRSRRLAGEPADEVAFLVVPPPPVG